MQKLESEVGKPERHLETQRKSGQTLRAEGEKIGNYFDRNAAEKTTRDAHAEMVAQKNLREAGRRLDYEKGLR